MESLLNALGNTRSCHRSNHLLQTPDTFVRASLPGMRNASAIVHAAPVIGAKFIQYTVEMEAGGVLPSNGLQRFLYVLTGELRVDLQVQRVALEAQSYCYVPAAASHQIEAEGATRFLVIEKPYQELSSAEKPVLLSGRVAELAASPLMGDSSLQVQKMIPETPAYDFAVNLMTFEPGASLPMVEIHFMEHGLTLLSGAGIYRLGDCWHPVAAGDFIWMAPYCPQWFGALGKQTAQYLIYKDWSRAPVV